MRTLASVAAALFTLGLPAMLNAQEAPIQACVGRSGKLRVVDAASGCTKKETPLSWAVAGPQGPEGPPGPAGSGGVSCVTTARLTIDNLPGVGANGAMDILQYSFSYTYEPPFGGAGSGTLQFGDLAVTKRIDAASPAIFQAATAGDRYATAKLEILGADGATGLMTYELSNAVVTSVQQASGACDVAPIESIGLRFELVKLQNP